MKFRVTMTGRAYREIEVDADSVEEAMEKAEDGVGITFRDDWEVFDGGSAMNAEPIDD